MKQKKAANRIECKGESAGQTLIDGMHWPLFRGYIRVIENNLQLYRLASPIERRSMGDAVKDAQEMARASHAFGEFDLYIGDDGQIHH